MRSSCPSHAPIGSWLGASGERGSFLVVSVVGLYAAPSDRASPQQPPPQPIASPPVQATIPSGITAWIRRHSSVLGLYATFSPNTRARVPVQTAAVQQPRPRPARAGGESVRQTFLAGSKEIAAFTDGSYVVLV